MMESGGFVPMVSADMIARAEQLRNDIANFVGGGEAYDAAFAMVTALRRVPVGALIPDGGYERVRR